MCCEPTADEFHDVRYIQNVSMCDFIGHFREKTRSCELDET